MDLQTDAAVVVLNTHHSGLAIARDLGPFGVRVFGLSAVPDSPGNRSRWLQYRACADSLREPAALLAQLIALAQELPQRPILLPTRDHDIEFIGAHRETLDAYFVLPLLPPRQLDRIMNKRTFADLAASVGIKTPKAVTVERDADLDAVRSLTFPCICKPVYASQWRKPGIWEAVGRQKALRVDTLAELKIFYAGFANIDPRVEVQEWIEGGEENLLIFGSCRGTSRRETAWFTARKRLQYPSLAGTGIVVEALPVPEVVEPALRLLDALDFRGISEIEFKRDRRNGELYVIELNPRHWDQHGLGTRVGVNLSEALYRHATEQPWRPMAQSTEPVRWIAEAEYLRHAARALTGRAPLSDLLLGVGGRRAWSVLDTDDWGPFRALIGMRGSP